MNIEENEKFQLSESKLLWENRNKVKKRFMMKVGKKGMNQNFTILDSRVFEQKFMNYLLKDTAEGQWSEKNSTDLYYKIIDTVMDPIVEGFDKAQLIADCKRFLRTITNPVFSGAMDPMINKIDFTFVNELMNNKANKGIEYEKHLQKEEISLLREYEQLRHRMQYKDIQKAYWKPLYKVRGVHPPTMEGATM